MSVDSTSIAWLSESRVYWPKMAQPNIVFQVQGLFPVPGLESGSMMLDQTSQPRRRSGICQGQRTNVGQVLDACGPLERKITRDFLYHCSGD